jgi:DNA repair protein RadC
MAVPKRKVFETPQEVRDYLRLMLGTEQREVFSVLFFTSQLELIAYEPMFAGSLASSHVYPREILQRVLHHRAFSVILSHNHPSGSVSPSGADIKMTDKIQAILGLIDVCVLDHVIVSSDAALSMRELGLVK